MEGAGDVDVFQSLPSRLRSWTTKQGLAKGSRWFSWNEQCQQHLQEWYGSRMLLEWYYGNLPCPEESEQKFSFKDRKGLQLMYSCLSSQLWEDCCAVYMAQKPLHEFYSQQLHFVKSCADGLAECIRLTENWASDAHLLQLAATIGTGSFAIFNCLVGRVENEHSFAQSVWKYGLECLANRCSTFSKSCSPPHCWALILSEDLQQQRKSMLELRKDWNWIVAVECSTVPVAPELGNDLRLSFGSAERLLVQCFEAANFIPRNSPAAMQLLLQLCGGFADTKLIEDLHQKLRVATGSQATKRVKGSAVQQIIQQSGCLDQRSIPHPCNITKNVFLAAWPRTKAEFRPKSDFKASEHKLPKEYSKILTPKTWQTISEEQLTKSAAGWMWLRHYLGIGLANHGFRLQARWVIDSLTCDKWHLHFD